MLVAHWPLHEDSGSTAYDVRGNNDGTVNGATMGVEGILGESAYSFDGSNDVIDLNSYSQFDSYTLTFWSRPNSVSDGSNDQQVTMDTNNAFLSRNEGGGTQYYYHNDGSWISVSAPTSNGVWEFWVCKYDGSNIYLYKNGVEKSSASVSGVGNTDGGNAIGSNAGGANYFDGDIADVRIYDHALSPHEVQYLHEVSRRGQLVTGRQVI